MYTGKKYSMCQWEKVLKAMIDNKEINAEILEQNEDTKDIPMYRLSSYIYHVKLAGGVVKVVKDGRNIKAYILTNPDDMVKYLAGREKTFKSSTTKIVKLKDLAAKPAKKAPAKKPAKPKKVETASTDEIVVEEVKETV